MVGPRRRSQGRSSAESTRPTASGTDASHHFDSINEDEPSPSTRDSPRVSARTRSASRGRSTSVPEAGQSTNPTSEPPVVITSYGAWSRTGEMLEHGSSRNSSSEPVLSTTYGRPSTAGPVFSGPSTARPEPDQSLSNGTSVPSRPNRTEPVSIVIDRPFNNAPYVTTGNMTPDAPPNSPLPAGQSNSSNPVMANGVHAPGTNSQHVGDDLEQGITISQQTPFSLEDDQPPSNYDGQQEEGQESDRVSFLSQPMDSYSTQSSDIGHSLTRVEANQSESEEVAFYAVRINRPGPFIEVLPDGTVVPSPGFFEEIRTRENSRRPRTTGVDEGESRRSAAHDEAQRRQTLRQGLARMRAVRRRVAHERPNWWKGVVVWLKKLSWPMIFISIIVATIVCVMLRVREVI